MPGRVGSGEAAAGDELAPVPLRSLLLAAFHPAPAESAANSAAQHVEAAIAAPTTFRIVGTRLLGADLFAVRTLIDKVEELPRDDRLVDRRRASDPLLSRGR